MHWMPAVVICDYSARLPEKKASRVIKHKC